MKTAADWILRLVPAIILLQTLFFKYTGAPESIHIFKEIGIEPWGRYVVATLELISAIALLIPRTAGIGALLALAIMLGAIAGHFTQLGIAVAGDGGLLFTMAIVVAVSSAMVAWTRRKTLALLWLRRKINIK